MSDLARARRLATPETLALVAQMVDWPATATEREMLECATIAESNALERDRFKQLVQQAQQEIQRARQVIERLRLAVRGNVEAERILDELAPPSPMAEAEKLRAEKVALEQQLADKDKAIADLSSKATDKATSNGASAIERAAKAVVAANAKQL